MVMSKKQFTDEDRLSILAAALEADDIRPLLAEEGLKRQRLADIARKALENGVLTAEEVLVISQAIEKPKAFPIDTEQRIDAILSGVVNTEPKQILTLLLDDNPQSIGDLRDGFVEVTGGIWVPKMLGKSIEDYLLQSLDPVGFVAHPVLQDFDVRHKATEAGKRYGQPVAAYVLDLGRQVDFSFYQLLGRTSSRGDSRAPYNRFRILEILLKSDCRMADLAEQLSLRGESVIRHLRALRELGFVEFDSVGSEQSGWAVYKWKEGKPEDAQTVKKMTRLTQDVAEWLYRNKVGSYYQIKDYFIQREGYENWKEHSLLITVSAVLVGLKEQGFADSRYQGGKELSHIKLTQKEFAEEFTRKVRSALLDGPELEGMEVVDRQYQTDPERFRQDARRRLEIYVRVSPDINKKSSDERVEDILAYVSAKGEVRPRDATRDLGGNSMKYLRSMVEQGSLVKETYGRAVVYRAK